MPNSPFSPKKVQKSGNLSILGPGGPFVDPLQPLWTRCNLCGPAAPLVDLLLDPLLDPLRALQQRSSAKVGAGPQRLQQVQKGCSGNRAHGVGTAGMGPRAHIGPHGALRAPWGPRQAREKPGRHGECRGRHGECPRNRFRAFSGKSGPGHFGEHRFLS